jgi:multicomponent K+:H+ antiporter subunit E
MTRWLPYPLFSFSLLAMWLVLNQTLAPAHILPGVALAFAGGKALALLQVPSARVRRRAISIALIFWMVFVDIVRSNIAVARIVLNPGLRGRTAGFIAMPLEVRHPGALAVLACIITATPGTSWARYDAARNVLFIHVLDLVDERAWIGLFKDKYERRLKEIFE